MRDDLVHIQNTIVDRLRSVWFPCIRHDAAGRIIPPSPSDSVRANGILVGEVQAAFDQDSQDGREISVFCSARLFSAILSFDREVAVDAVLDAFEHVPTVAGYLVKLAGYETTRPPKRDSDKGMEVELTFSAERLRS